MWDARFDSIRDRKLNELVIFSAMVRTDQPNRKEYEDIIRHLFSDLDVLDALISEKPLPDSEPILSPLYRSRLSKYESLDEYVMDQCRKGMMDEDEKVSLKSPASQDKIEAPDELDRISPAKNPDMIEAPQEIEKIAQPDDSERIEAPEDKNKLSAAKSQDMIEAPEVPQKIESPVAQASITAPEVPQMIEQPTARGEEESPADTEEIKPQSGSDFTFELVISIDDAVTLKKVKEMKDAKIDHFIDEEMSGHTKEDACEAVIDFLKNDVVLIDKILNINVSSKSGIEESLRDIIEFVESADEPKYQKIYLNSLNFNEKDLEGEYNNVLRRLEAVIHDRYAHLMNETHSVFFEE